MTRRSVKSSLAAVPTSPDDLEICDLTASSRDAYVVIQEREGLHRCVIQLPWRPSTNASLWVTEPEPVIERAYAEAVRIARAASCSRVIFIDPARVALLPSLPHWPPSA